jgi:hypothetical protein
MADVFNHMDLFRLALKYKKPLAVLVLASGLLAFFFSSPLFIPPKFKSSAVIYPSNLIPYGIETPSEQMLQLFQSNVIKDSLIRRHQLSRHYGVDESKTGWKTNLMLEVSENIRVSKTEYEAVEIEVLDTNPDTAYRMMRSMIYFFNKITRNIHKEKSQEVVNIVSRQIMLKQKEIDSISLALKEIKIKYGIIDYKSQAKEAAKEYYRSLGGNPKKTADIVVSIRNLEEKGNDFIALNEQLKSGLDNLYKLKIDLDNAVRDVTKELTYTNVIIQPMRPDKKAYPIRWLICSFTMLSTLLGSLIVISIVERRGRLS